MSKKILITGPECTGKTTLAQELSRFYGSTWVPEYARRYLMQIGREYEEHDLLVIARGQLREEREAAASGASLLFLDTSLLVMKIWSEYKYGRCDPWIESSWQEASYDVILLLRPDIEWEYDPLRESPKYRDQLFEAYEKYLKESGKKYHVISGQGNKRLERAVKIVQKALMS